MQRMTTRCVYILSLFFLTESVQGPGLTTESLHVFDGVHVQFQNVMDFRDSSTTKISIFVFDDADNPEISGIYSILNHRYLASKGSKDRQLIMNETTGAYSKMIDYDEGTPDQIHSEDVIFLSGVSTGTKAWFTKISVAAHSDVITLTPLEIRRVAAIRTWARFEIEQDQWLINDVFTVHVLVKPEQWSFTDLKDVTITIQPMIGLDFQQIEQHKESLPATTKQISGRIIIFTYDRLYIQSMVSFNVSYKVTKVAEELLVLVLYEGVATDQGEPVHMFQQKSSVVENTFVSTSESVIRNERYLVAVANTTTTYVNNNGIFMCRVSENRLTHACLRYDMGTAEVKVFPYQFTHANGSTVSTYLWLDSKERGIIESEGIFYCARSAWSELRAQENYVDAQMVTGLVGIEGTTFYVTQKTILKDNKKIVIFEV